MEFWLCPNMATADMGNLFREPDLWATARKHVSVVQLYVQLLTSELPDRHGIAACGPNAWPFLSEGADAFRRLRDMGLGLALEAGAVKPGDCQAEANIQAILKAIRRVRENGGETHFVSVDESLVSAETSCNQEIEATAKATAHYIAAVRDEGANVGILEAYPANTPEKIVRFVDLLAAEGQAPAHLHLDVDRLAFNRGGRVPTKKLRQDLRAVCDGCKRHGMKFGLIVWANIPPNDGPAPFKKEALELTRIFRAVAPPALDRLIVQSWHDSQTDPDGYPKLVNPHNLPDADPNSLTRLAIDVKRRFEEGEPTTLKTLVRAVLESAKGEIGIRV